MCQDDGHCRLLRFACIHTLLTWVEASSKVAGLVSYNSKKYRSGRRDIQHDSSKITREDVDYMPFRGAEFQKSNHINASQAISENVPMEQHRKGGKERGRSTRNDCMPAGRATVRRNVLRRALLDNRTKRPGLFWPLFPLHIYFVFISV